MIQRNHLKEIEHQRIKEKRRREKKTREQIDYLENEYQKNANWDYQKKCDIALFLNLTFGCISKWNWDRRKKDEAMMKDNNNNNKKSDKSKTSE